MKKYLIARTYLHYAQFVLYFGKRLNVIKKSIFDIYARQLIKKGNFVLLLQEEEENSCPRCGWAEPATPSTAKRQNRNE